MEITRLHEEINRKHFDLKPDFTSFSNLVISTATPSRTKVPLRLLHHRGVLVSA